MLNGSSEIKSFALQLKAGVGVIEVMNEMNARGAHVLAIVDAASYLIGEVSFREIRKGILNRKKDLEGLINYHPGTVKEGVEPQQVTRLMKANQRRHLWVVDDQNRLRDMIRISQTEMPAKPHKVVIMAGGRGSRLGELTRHLPKPMLELGTKPVLDLIVSSFIDYGFNDIYISVNYKQNLIKEHFGDGSDFGVKIQYIEEDECLGTGGALSLIENELTTPFILMNGDLLTSLNFESLMEFHLEREAVATMCLHEYTYQVPFGVVTAGDAKMISMEEKPIQTYFVNAGIYVINPELLRYIPHGQYFDITSLFEFLLREDIPAHTYIINEFWMDIGKQEDYSRAKSLFNKS